MTEDSPYFASHPTHIAIYTSSIAFFLIIISSLPFLKTNVSVITSGIIRPSVEITTIRSITSGKIKEVRCHENLKVKAGNTLYIMESESLIEQGKYLQQEIAIQKSYLKDLKAIISFSNAVKIASQYTSNSVTIKTDLYNQEYFSFQQKVKEASLIHHKTKQEFDRQSKLFDERVIAVAEFENSRFELKKTEEGLMQLHQTQLTQWQNDLKILIEKVHNLQSQLVRVQKEESLLTINAPLNGTVQNITTLYRGSLVAANQELAQITPDTNLVVIAYVPPNEIGLIKKGMKIRFQIDAFNHNQWGLGSGAVLEIPTDIKIIDSKPVFEVRCSLDQDFLQLKNDYKGILKRGMTLRARFIVARRSFWQLLYDKTDDWINPNL